MSRYSKMRRIATLAVALVMVMALVPWLGHRANASSQLGLEHLLRGFNVLSGSELKNGTLAPSSILSNGAAESLSSYSKVDVVEEAAARIDTGRSLAEAAGNSKLDMSVSAKAEVDLGKLFKANASSKYGTTVNSSFSSSFDSRFFNMYVYYARNKNSIDMSSTEVRTSLQRALSPDFLNALLNEKDIKGKLFEQYGTHFLNSYARGGWVEASISTTSTSEAISDDIKNAYEAAAGLKVPKVAIDAAFKLEQDTKSSSNASKFNTKVYSSASGGSAIQGLSFIDDLGKSEDTIKKWGNTFTDANSVILTDEYLGLTGIWELIPVGYDDRYVEVVTEYLKLSMEQDRQFLNEFLYKSPLTSGFERAAAIEGIPPAPDNGVPANATKISSQEDLRDKLTNKSGYFVLTQDIPISGAWTPISGFSGTLDGQGYVISNLNMKIDGNSQSYAGLFGRISSGTVTIKNLGIQIGSSGVINDSNNGLNVERQVNSGGIIGETTGGNITIENCYVTSGLIRSHIYRGTNAAYACAGGLIGRVSSGSTVTIRNSYATSRIEAETEVGGFGWVITGHANAGGLVGYRVGTLNIENCYTTGQAWARTYFGWGSSWTGDEKPCAGGLIGKELTTTTPVKSYYVNEGSTVGSNGSITKRGTYITAENLNNQSYFTGASGWDYDRTWMQGSPPTLRKPGDVVVKPTFYYQYKASRPNIVEGSVLKLSDIMTLFFLDKEVTSSANLYLRYNFSQSGMRNLQIVYVDGNKKYVCEIAGVPVIGIEIPPIVRNDNGIYLTQGLKNGIILRAVITESGVYFDWWLADGSKATSPIGYRIYRSSALGSSGVSISDFPLKEDSFFDANVDSNTWYYYSIAEVITGADFDEATVTLIPETVGVRGEEIAVRTGIIIPPEKPIVSGERGFIMMTIGDPLMRVNEETREIDPGRNTVPIIVSGRTMLPIRAIVQAINGEERGVEWDEEERCITLEGNDRVVQMWIDNKDILVNGQPDTIDIAPFIGNGRTFIPVRFVAENLGLRIEWLSTANKVVIVYYLPLVESSDISS